jgi:N5-(carboxyethyl)ornithine synthase
MRVGFPKTQLPEEKRLALLPNDVGRLSAPNKLYFQNEFGEKQGVADEEYRQAGANVDRLKNVYKCDIICQPKFTLVDVRYMRYGQTGFGWFHLEGGKVTKELSQKKITAIAWEKMFKEGTHVFWRNNELAGEIGVTHAISYADRVPTECNVAVIGRGNVGRGARKQLEKLGVREPHIYHTENFGSFLESIAEYDVIVHCSNASTYIINKESIKQMRPGALLVQIGSDAIEGIRANSVFAPVSGINIGKNLVYCVNHVPTLNYKTPTRVISKEVAPYIDMLVKGEMDNTLRKAIVIYKGAVGQGIFRP